MSEKPTYEELEQRVKELEKESVEHKQAEAVLRKAEEALRESEEKYRNLFENAVEGFFQSTPEGRFISVNPAFAKMLGYASPEELIANISDIAKQYYVNPEDRHRYQQLLQKGGTVENFEFKAKRKDGSQIWVSNSTRAYFDKDGKVDRYEGIVLDITERKQAEEALIKSETFLKATGQIAKVGGWEIDGETQNVFWTKEIYNITEVPPDYDPSSLEKEAIVFFNEEDQLRLEKAIQRAFEHREPYDMELLITTAKGNKKWVQAICEPVVVDGKVVKLGGTFQDINERRQTEEALRESDAKLRQAQKMEAIGTLAGGIAHEFNNIIGIILGNTELAIDDVPEWNPAKECLIEVRSACMRAKDVVRHILSFARKTPAQRKPIRISTIIRDSLKLMRASIPTTIEIRQNISCESEMILADATEVNQILMNLCTNSLHALSEETGVVEVTLENQKLKMKNEELGLEAGRYVRLTVRDTGSGIEPEIINRIFDPYFTTKDIGRGTGMGLAVAYGIVKKHDGAITASSEPGKGTVVEVWFPLIDEGAEHEVEEEPQALPAGTERILFLDDEEGLVRAYTASLKSLGYDVASFTDALKALEVFQKNPEKFDLVITDMAMPLMAGDKFARELMEIRPDIPVILCTGHSAHIDEASAKELGVAAYAMKPLVMRDFANTIRRVLNSK